MTKKKKDPRRWQDVLVSSPHAELTKQEVFDYYSIKKIQRAILDAAGNRETLVRQSFTPEYMVLRRKGPKGNLIRLTPKQFERWKNIRTTEFHPTFGKRVKELLVDIDPQEGVSWDRAQRLTETVAKTLQSEDDIKRVHVQYSGGRGFYVRGDLERNMDTKRARERMRNILNNLVQRPDVTFGVAEPGQIRLDLTPFKHRGSVRAPYSLNAATGLVAAPVKVEDLGKLKKTDFTIENILEKKAVPEMKKTSGHALGTPEFYQEMRRIVAETSTLPGGARLVDRYIRDPKTGKITGVSTHLSRAGTPPRQRPHEADFATRAQQNAWDNQIPNTRVAYSGKQKEFLEKILGRKVAAAKNEFAPGIPKNRKIHKLPTVKKQEPEWMLAIQEHIAKRAGKHYDLRLVQPLTDKAHSWAIPKARLPNMKDKMLLAIQQPTHKRDYALHFTGTLPEGYGAGTVTMPMKEKTTVLYSDKDRIGFQLKDGDQYAMFRTKGKNWGIKKVAALETELERLLKEAENKVEKKKKKRGTAFIREKMR